MPLSTGHGSFVLQESLVQSCGGRQQQKAWGKVASVGLLVELGLVLQVACELPGGKSHKASSLPP